MMKLHLNENDSDAKEVIDNFVNFAESVILEFEIDIDDEFCQLTLNKMPLQVIFANLLNNAIKHHDKSSGRDKDGDHNARLYDLPTRYLLHSVGPSYLSSQVVNPITSSVHSSLSRKNSMQLLNLSKCI